MSGLLPTRAKVSPSTARNRHPILEVLKPRLPPTGFVLEIAAGFGEHAVYNATTFPNLNWQPTDKDPDSLDSIAAWRDHAGLPNLLAPLQLDAADPTSWRIANADVIININMIHIAPWTATEGLMTARVACSHRAASSFYMDRISSAVSKPRRATGASI